MFYNIFFYCTLSRYPLILCIPIPAAEEGLDTWLEQSWMMITESELPTREKWKRIIASLNDPNNCLPALNQTAIYYFMLMPALRSWVQYCISSIQGRFAPLPMPVLNWVIIQFINLATKWAVVVKFHNYLYKDQFTTSLSNNPHTYILMLARWIPWAIWLEALSAYDFGIQPGFTDWKVKLGLFEHSLHGKMSCLITPQVTWNAQVPQYSLLGILCLPTVLQDTGNLWNSLG